MTPAGDAEVPTASDGPDAMLPVDEAPVDEAPVDEAQRETEQTIRSISRLEEQN